MYNAQDYNFDADDETADAKTEIVVENTNGNLEKIFLLARYSPPKLNLTSFQRPHEPRIKYLLRSLKLWQEYVNSGALDKLKILLNDILTVDCLMLTNNAIPPVVGRHNIYEQRMSLNRNIPDYCVFFNNIVRPKRRVITLSINCFGTMPHPNTNDRSTLTWNIFEYVPMDKLDEHHKIQKQKYDALKAQNKTIKMEHRASWFLLLSRDLKCIAKIMATNSKLDVF